MVPSLKKKELVALLFFGLWCVYTVCLGLFALPLGVTDRPCDLGLWLFLETFYTVILVIYESQREKTNLLPFAKRRLKSTCASRSLIRVFAVRMKNLCHPQLSKMRPVKFTIRLSKTRRLILIFSGRTCPKVRFF